MQSFDEILLHIESRTEQLVRKLKELSMDNEKLQTENNQLKQDILANKEVNLFSTSVSEDVNVSPETQDNIVTIKQELDHCIQDVKDCLALVGE